MFRARAPRIFINRRPSAVMPLGVCLQHTEYISAPLSALERAVCSSSQTKRRGKHSTACTLTHSRRNTWLCGKPHRQDTRQTNCLFARCCVSDLLIMPAKSCDIALPLSGVRPISWRDKHKRWPGVRNPCSHLSLISGERLCCEVPIFRPSFFFQVEHTYKMKGP